MRTFLLFFFIFSFLITNGQIRLPRLISDGMVLQRDSPIKLWGWAAPGEKITVSFNRNIYVTNASADGRWIILLPSQRAGGPYTMRFFASDTVTINDILIGDVWICSGQSNMELPMRRVRYKYAGLIQAINNPMIRQFEVPDRYNFKQQGEDLPSGQWVAATTENILSFSAVAYFFADEINRSYQVPVGLINAAVGGSPAEAWISEEALKVFPIHYREAVRFKNDSLIAKIEDNDRQLHQHWYKLLHEIDQGLKDNWIKPSLNDEHWHQMNLPGYWSDNGIGQTNGSMWFRKTIQLPKTMAGQSAELLLGRIVDADSAFINGQFVGSTNYQYPPRRYAIPTGLLKEGENVIVVRVVNSSGKGGFVPDKPYQILSADTSIDLTGPWKFKPGAAMEPLPSQTFIRWKPLGLYNAMIAPLIHYPIKGVLWYQGESNTQAPAEYKELMTALIKDWRRQWNQGYFAFLFVQLPNFMEAHTTPTESNWARLRQAQLEMLTVPNTGMAVAIDLGEWNDIHPLNKKDIGIRLALQAKRLAYGDKKIVSSGPLFKSLTRKGNKLVLSFSDVGSGLIAIDNKPLQHFAIAGTDNRFVWAVAKIKGRNVVVWNDAVVNPVSVRYAWADNPASANLYNKEKLPASPFEANLLASPKKAKD
jgi:sialate O-acetylesterase